MTRSEYVPLDMVADCQSDHVSWNVELPPYAPDDRIGVDVTRLDKIARIGGFKSIQFVDYVGETTEFIPELKPEAYESEVLTDPKGTLRQASLHCVDTDYGQRWDTDYDHADVTVGINMAEVTDILGNRQDDGALRSPEAWSDILNQATSRSVRSAARKHLVVNAPAIEKLTPVYYAASAGCTELLGDDPSLTGTAIRAGAWMVGWQVAAKPALDTVKKKDRSDRRFSLVSGMHVDRVLAVEALSRFGRIIKPVT